MLGWIADFYCAAVKLVIEVDGTIHDAKKDAIRDRVMNNHGLNVLRLTSSDVEADIEWATQEIKKEVERLIS